MRLLRRLGRYPASPVHCEPVLGVRDFALDRLLDHLDESHARGFVRDSIGELIEHDAREGSTLVRTLELALDFPRRDDAAHAGFMHRNTFRRRLQEAVDVIDADLDDPGQRLVLHLALRLRRHVPG